MKPYGTTPADRRLTSLAERAVKEAQAVQALAPALQDAQWLRGRRPDVAFTGRAKGGPPADPTGETAVDPARLTVREELRKAERHLLDAVALLTGTRAGFERALTKWEGTSPVGTDG